MLTFSDNQSKKRLLVVHVEGKYEGEYVAPLSLLSILPTVIFLQNVNSPTLDVLTGPSVEGPWVSVQKIKKGKIEKVEKFITHLNIQYQVNKNYDFWFTLHK